MKTEQWERTKQLLEEALRLAPAERQSYLDQACGADSELRAEVESLLTSYQKAGSQFLAPPVQEFLDVAFTDPPPALPNRMIGNYRLVEEIGRGGMGRVWLAEQTAPVRRRVALKLIKTGLYDNEVLKRFQLERQSLAIMDHPLIAKVFDAGSTADGQPYFVMEYVPGVPITQYCDEKRLSIRERLQLFIKVSEAVQHAHQKAIIHRDLKPANILVQQIDGKPVPRIIDFGLAKASGPQMSGDSLHTQLGGFVGTPGYMSPEQCDGAADIDTRTDVYSLGVVLYVLLTGCMPFQPKPGKEQPVEEILRQVREDDPPRPSTKVTTDRETSSTVAEARGTEPNRLASLLRGDLDWITMKVLERDRSRRYGTASELAADLTRYLNHEPVIARPASTAYRLRRYVRRHRVGVAVVVGSTVLLAGFAVTQTLQVRRVTRERDRAKRITDFMTQMFKVSDPSEARGNTITVREVLDKASRDIDSGLASDPQVQAQMMSVMGEVYENLGLYSREYDLLTRALTIERSVLGPENPETLSGARALGRVLIRQGRFPEAEKLLRQTLALQRRVVGPENPETLKTMNSLAVVLESPGSYDESEKLYREALQTQRRILGPEHHDTRITMVNLTNLLLFEKRYDEGEKLIRQVLEIQQRLLGADHPETLNSQNLLSSILVGENRYPEAEKVMDETLVIQQRVLGPEHQRTLDLRNGISWLAWQQGRYGEAEASYRETRAISARVYGPADPFTASCTYQLASFEAARGFREQALALLTDAVDHGLLPDAALGIEQDDTFKSLRDDPRFAALIAHAKERAAAQKQN